MPGERFGGNQVRRHMGRWDQYVRSWADQTQLPVLIMRYEDMLANGLEAFTKLSRFLGLPDKPRLIQKALDNISIDRLKSSRMIWMDLLKSQHVASVSFAQVVQGKGRSSFPLSSESVSPRNWLRR